MPQKKIGYSAKRSSTSSFSSSKRRQVGFKNYKKGVSIMDHSFKAVLGATSTAKKHLQVQVQKQTIVVACYLLQYLYAS